MKKMTLKDIIICVLATVFIFGMFCLAGTMDYQHDVDMGYITETK